jgi:hypothetical protein
MELALYGIALITCIGLVQRILFAKKLIAEAVKEDKILPYFSLDSFQIPLLLGIGS